MSSAPDLEPAREARPRKSLALRLVGLYALVFGLSIAALSAVTWFAAERAIRGQATAEQTEALLEEGISVMPLPIPAGLKGPLQ